MWGWNERRAFLLLSFGFFVNFAIDSGNRLLHASLGVGKAA